MPTPATSDHRSTSRNIVRHLLLASLIAAATAAGYHKLAKRPEPAAFQPQRAEPIQGNVTAELQTRFVSTRQDIHTHAASLIELGDGRIRAFWFAGSREGAEDVEIYSAVFDPVKNQWGPERSVVNRLDTQRMLWRYVKRIGNPVPMRANDGTLWLFYVTVSLGGWAGSSITALVSHDDGATWGQARRLITSPFLNISTLVKGTPFQYQDGTHGLPVYHEFIGKFGELLRLDDNGHVLDKQRLSSGNTTLQPVMLINSPQQALALMRYAGSEPGRVIATHTEDAGQHWSSPVRTVLANPDAALTATVLPDGKLLAVLNDIEQGRDALSLVLSGDGGAHWKTLYQLEDQRGKQFDREAYARTIVEQVQQSGINIAAADGYVRSAQHNKCVDQQCAFEFSYPYLIQERNGDFHLVYTWNRSFIKHVQFNHAWLQQRIAEAEHAH